MNMQSAHEMENEQAVLVDGHVHFYDCFDRQIYFDSASANFQSAAAELELKPSVTGCLLFTETSRQHYFQKFKEAAGCDDGGWSFRETLEDESLIASKPGGGEIVIVAGRQIATAENLEVLALGYDGEFVDRLPLAVTLEAVIETGALAVIPWGFGKWTRRRGELVAATVNQVRPGEMFLGDNGGRLRWGARPALFASAEARGVAVLPGSDPLPFADEVSAVARYGFVLPGEIDQERPAAWLKGRLVGLGASPIAFGRLQSLPRFCRYQLAMQLRKFCKRSAL